MIDLHFTEFKEKEMAKKIKQDKPQKDAPQNAIPQKEQQEDAMQELPALNIKEMPPPGPDATPEQIEAYAQAMAADDNARKAAKDADEAHGRQMDIESDYGRIGPIGQEEIREAAGIMEKYKQGKKNLDERIVANEEWYKMRHWEQIRKKKKTNDPEPASAWLFNSLANKHADAMDNYPEPNVLPRSADDRQDAQTLGHILPVIMERNQFEETYSNAWWYKLKAGSSVYGVFWNKSLEEGLGDIDIQQVDILNFFWEPGIKDIQKSRNIFVVSLEDNDILEEKYDFLRGKLASSTIDVKEYIYDDTVDNTEKSAVIDWYYKRTIADENGMEKEILHYVKFVNDEVLYASENDWRYQERGYYDHGTYPFVFDVMFMEEGTPAGFGYLDIMKDAQMYIDKLDANIMKGSFLASNPRFWIKDSSQVNQKEFEDPTKMFVHVAGQIGEESIRKIEISPADATTINVRQMKIDELKETSGNRDFSQGSTQSGVTAASAIAALQEAGSKLSRDMIKTSYRAYAEICYLCIELIRQFYDEEREFRIGGQNGQDEFISFDNRNIRTREDSAFGIQQYRRPIFDIKIVPQKSSPFSKAAQNNMAMELYGAGFFAPQMVDQALVALQMMQFEGKEEIAQRLSQNGTMFQIMQQMQADMQKMAFIIDSQLGTNVLQNMGIAANMTQPVGADVKTNNVQTNSLGDTQKQKTTQEAKARQQVAQQATPKA
jgi:hypothetical protein|uniref:Portal protein n=1 Tax=Podoviridae sp. ctZ5d16 TaxID=2825257 RepID=A0A8S5Q9K6_9CAUD|nr:MAG TPA: portal protein [Podoviridae sp. ctZ5d16]